MTSSCQRRLAKDRDSEHVVGWPLSAVSCFQLFDSTQRWNASWELSLNSEFFISV